MTCPENLDALRALALDRTAPLGRRVEAARLWLDLARVSGLDLTLVPGDPTAPGWVASEMAGVVLELPDE